MALQAPPSGGHGESAVEHDIRPSSPFDSDRIRIQIRRWQDTLLDLSKSNPLVNLERARASKLRIVSPEAQELFVHLVIRESEVRMPLVRKKVTTAEESVPVDDADLERGYYVEPGDVDFELPALELKRKLRRIFDNGKSSVEERGVTTLYMTFGALRWRDDQMGESLSPIWMVPCQFESKGPNAALRLQMSDEEMRLNPALEYYFRERHKIHLPSIPEDPNEADLGRYLAGVSKAVLEHDWIVIPDMWLSTFMFESLVIYQDLKELTETATTNPIVAALARAGTLAEKSEALGDVLDELPTPDMVPIPILPADSSQLKALVQAASHQNIVIHGPPGTGKSQTISNLIADALGRNEKVLFVSAKMAALNVVHDRLKKEGLARFCLEAHSTKAGKAKVIEELRRTLESESGGDRGLLDEELTNLLKVRKQLTSYVQDLHSRHEPLGRTLYQAIGKIAKLGKAPDVRAPMPWPDIRTVSRADLDACCDALEYLSQSHDAFDNRATHPWRGYEPAEGASFDYESVESDLKLVGNACQTILNNLGVLSVFIPRHRELTVTELELYRPAAEALSRVEQLPRDWWLRTPNALEASAAILRTASDLVIEEHGKKVEFGKAFSIPIRTARELLSPASAEFGVWYRTLLPSYWKWRSRIIEKILPNAHRGYSHLVSYLGLSERLIEIEDWLEVNGQEIFSAVGAEQSPSRLAAAAAQANAGSLLHAALKASLREAVPGPCAVSSKMRDAAKNLTENCLSSWTVLSESLKRIDSQWPEGFADGSAVTDAPCLHLSERCHEVLSGILRFREWQLLYRSLQRCDKLGLSPFIKRLGTVSAKDAKSAFEKRFHRLWVNAAIEASPHLAQFSEANHRDLIEKFRILDEKLLRLAIRRIQRTASEPARRIRSAGEAPGIAGEVAKLRVELQRKRPRALRKLFGEIPSVLQALKPCMLMSPISVSTYLKPGAFHFDLVVFDEASQLPTAEAIPSVLRAKRAVVAGDANQLPPTTFFSTSMIQDDDDLDEIEGAENVQMESLLNDCVAIVPVFQEARLRWHYRSRDERLIKFSNHYFYNNNLVTFPAPYSGSDGRGVRLVHVQDGVWDRGRSRTNRREARIVAQLVIENLARFPGRSIGIAAMNASQREAIEDAIGEEIQKRPDLLPLLDAGRDEPYFVKSLENVQGDERDTIIISIGYGKDANGSLALNFGPLNLEGGWRRLNVLVTRAKWQTILVTSMQSQELRGVNPQNRGAVALKNFIEYAERGAELPPEAAVVTEGETNDFEDAVCEALRERGLTVDQQVGASQFRIDMAIRDRRDSARYILGIECDGATYHSSPTARDRDLLRQQVLREMGWRLHRLWSTEWFHNPESAILSILRSLEQAETIPVDELVTAPAKREPESHAEVAPSISDPSSGGSNPSSTESDMARRFPAGVPYRKYEPPYQRANRDVLISRSYVGTLSREIKAIIEIEGPIHEDLLAERLKELHGVSRVGANIKANIDLAIHLLLGPRQDRSGQGKRFLYNSSAAVTQFRIPANGVRRPLELIPNEEIELAILHLVEDQFGMNRAHIPQAVARTFGIERLAAESGDLLREIVDDLIQRGILRLSGQNAYLA